MKYERIDAYKAGYQNIVQTLEAKFNECSRQHRERFGKALNEMQQDALSYLKDQNKNLDGIFENQNNLLLFSRLVQMCKFQSLEDTAKVEVLSSDQAYLLGKKDALDKVNEIIEHSLKFAEREEDKKSIVFLQSIVYELFELNFSFEEWKTLIHPTWYLSNKKQDESYFEEYCDYCNQVSFNNTIPKLE